MEWGDNMKRIVITMEGLDGAGKCINQLLQSYALVDLLFQQREPGGSRIAEGIRKSHSGCEQLRNGRERTEAILYAAGRRQHLKIVFTKLRKREYCFCDRFCR